MSFRIQTVTSLIGRLVSEFVSHHDSLNIDGEVIGRIGDVTIAAHAADTSRLIGRRGYRFKALASIICAIGNRHGKRIKLNRISDPVEGSKERFKKFAPCESWPAERIKRLLFDVSSEIFGDVLISSGDRANHRTMLLVEVSEETPSDLVDEITEAFNAIFDAIGKAQGRELLVGIENSLPVDKQPESNAGRFSD